MMKTKILTLLREQKDYVSGQQLCEQFGVSRTAVWKAIGQLRKEGYDIEAISNKGYRLREATDAEIYSKSEIASRIQTRWAGKKVYFYDEIGSNQVQHIHHPKNA